MNESIPPNSGNSPSAAFAPLLGPRERWLSYALRRWANARTRRNPFGHGKTGTALLNDAADYIDKLEAEVKRLSAGMPHAIEYDGSPVCWCGANHNQEAEANG